MLGSQFHDLRVPFGAHPCQEIAKNYKKNKNKHFRNFWGDTATSLVNCAQNGRSFFDFVKVFRKKSKKQPEK